MKLRADSFAARLTPAQRDELFVALAGGLSLVDAAKRVHEWTRAEWGGKPPSTQAISAWGQGERVRRTLLAAREAALVAEANAPADCDAQARRALGQAKFMAVYQDLAPREIAALEKNDIARQKLELERAKLTLDVRVQLRLGFTPG